MEAANCIGQWSLFDSRDAYAHHEARQLCATCPVILECAALLREVRKSSTGGPAGRPVGTWAGRLVGEVAQRRGRPRKVHNREAS